MPPDGQLRRIVGLLARRGYSAGLAYSVSPAEVDSWLGHDAFLGDYARIAPFVNELLRVGTEVPS